MTDAHSTAKAASESLERALQHGRDDVEGIVALYTDDACLFPPGGDFDGSESHGFFDGGSKPIERLSKAYTRSYWTHVYSMLTGGYKYVHQPLSIDVVGNIAHEVGRYSLAGSVHTDTGVTQVENGVYSILWRQEQDEWKIAVHILNSASRPPWVAAYLST